MKSIPVTPVLIEILKNALMDSYNFINECESSLDNYTPAAREMLIEGIEDRKQKAAVIKDLIERYND